MGKGEDEENCDWLAPDSDLLGWQEVEEAEAKRLAF